MIFVFDHRLIHLNMRLRLFGTVLLLLCCGVVSAQSAKPVDGYYRVKYPWSYNGVVWSFSVGIPENVYDFYRERTHYNDDLMHYILSDYDRDYIREIVSSFRAGGEKWGLSDLDNVFNVVSFVQSLKYVTDASSKGEEEYVRYPIETLVDAVGDCEDVVILAAAILHEMGYKVLLVLLPDHLALAIQYDKVFPGTCYKYDGDLYYYLEMTDKGWDLGQIPDRYESATAKLIPLVSRPLARLMWCGYQYASYTTAMTSVDFELQCTVENFGPGTTSGMSMRVRMKSDKYSEEAIVEHVYALQDLPEAGKATFKVTLPVPRPAQGVLEFLLEGQNFVTDTLVVEGVDLK